METAVMVLSIVCGLQSIALGTIIPHLLWRVLKHDQQLDTLDQVVEAIVEANRGRK